MTFTSFSFAVFFPIVVILYYLCPAKLRWVLLLLASCYFYIVFVPAYILVLFALILIDFFIAQHIEPAVGRKRTVLLGVSIVASVSILFVFKYFNFFNANLAGLAQVLGWNYSAYALKLLLPLGLSFHTFQSLSYVIEVYRGNYPAEKNLGIYALYVMFFPQLVAGPIERPQHLLPQLKTPVRFDPATMLSGIRLMAWGFFKKLVIADRLAISVTYIYANYLHVPGLSIFFALIFFSFQLYADFSGYSDIARGSARVLGIDIVNNFAQPYFSRSIAEFWRRWHISLSSWFRDYLFTPLALSWGRRSSQLGIYAAVLATFTLMGLWHGANWTFVAMGALFGAYIVIGMAIKLPRTDSVPVKALETLGTFTLVSLTWVFFRAPSLHTAVEFIAKLFTGWNFSAGALVTQYYRFPFDALGFGRSDLLIVLGAIAALLVVEHIQTRESISLLFNRQPLHLRSALYAGLALMLFIFSVLTTTEFIYFQF